ncbi:MAG TPA: cyclic nucleotide-binding domain-containing protein [Anaerolineales bacterium]|nr:cyclic nucleotide-binding domain-containing protein [Anaerolineales bacterium]
MTIETSARVAFLKKIHLFSGLEEADLEAVAHELEEQSVPAGGVIFKQGDKAESFYLIYSGSVRIVRKQDGKEIQLANLVQSDYFGEMALVAKRPRSATATATSDTLLLVLSRQDFEMLYKRSPQLRPHLEIAIKSRELARRLRFKWLRPDEVVYFLARKHPIVLYEKLILPVLALIVPLLFFYAWYALLPSILVALAGGLSLLAIVLWIAWLVIDWGNDYYIVTNQRVVWLEKVIGIYDSRQESPINTILSVGVEANPIGNFLDYGNVIVRTFVGKIPFTNVSHPDQARRMIEEYWNRTKEQASKMEKEAMKNAIRKQLGLPPPSQPQPDSDKKASPPPKRPKLTALLRLLGANTLKLRYESGESVIYRKHWIVLIMQAWIPLLGSLGTLALLFYRLGQILFDPQLTFFRNGFRPDTWVAVFFLAFFPFALWLIYEVIDWSNDKFEVTPEQIIDIDRKPFGTETRNAAQLENILGTEYKRLGLLGNLFNYGTVYITVGGTKLAFEDVMDPAAVQSDIDRRRMARQAKQNEAKIAAERERMAEWLAIYHKSAQEFLEEEKKKNQKSE